MFSSGTNYHKWMISQNSKIKYKQTGVLRLSNYNRVVQTKIHTTSQKYNKCKLSLITCILQNKAIVKIAALSQTLKYNDVLFTFDL